jgi:predicted ATPase
MKILELHVEGFRSLKDVIWKPGDLNVVIGPNASGKSNVLRAIDIIAVAAKGGLSDHVVEHGGMVPLSWDGLADIIRFGVTAAGRDPDTPGPNVLVYLLNLRRVGAHFRVDSENLDVQVPSIKDPDMARLLDRGRSEGALWDGGMPMFKFEELSNGDHIQLSSDETLLSRASSMFPLGSGFKTSIALFATSVGGFRVYEQIDVTLGSKVRQSVVARYEQMLFRNGDNLASVLHTWYSGNREFKEDLDNAMVTAFGADYQELVFVPAADQRIQLGIRWKSLSRVNTSADMSDGMIRFLYLLAILANPEPPSLIAIDEPETGLHPRMLPIIAEFAVAASLRSQVILTTHSPQLLDAFRVTNVAPTTTVARWEDGETKLTTLEAGELEGWLNDYTLGSLYYSGTLEAIA